MKKLLFLIGLLCFLWRPCGAEGWVSSTMGTETLPFEVRVSRCYTPLVDNTVTGLSFRFRTAIICSRTGITLGVGDNVEYAAISYELIPHYFDFIFGLSKSGDDFSYITGFCLDVKTFNALLEFLQ